MNEWEVTDDSFWLLLFKRLFVFIPLGSFDKQTVDVNSISRCFSYSMENYANKEIGKNENHLLI